MSAIKFNFNSEKALEVIIYIAKKADIPDVYHIGKVLYFADRIHLEKYGRFICGDGYFAMKHGPVPGGVYDILKYVRGDGAICFDKHFRNSCRNSFGIINDIIIPCRDANIEILSESDRECLDESIYTYGNLSFNDLKKKSHDAAFDSADRNDSITLEAIATTLKNSELIIDHLRNTEVG